MLLIKLMRLSFKRFNSVKKLLLKERDLALHKLPTFEVFRKKVEKSRSDLVNLLSNLKAQGKQIAGYGATSKSTTILNYCGIGPETINCIFDTTRDKIGKFSPGKHIPIVDHRNFKEKFYDYSFLFAWNHKREIEKKEKDYLRRGGKWITHL